MKQYLILIENLVREGKSEREIENIHPTTYSSSAGETPATVLPKLIRTYPEVIAGPRAAPSRRPSSARARRPGATGSRVSSRAAMAIPKDHTA